MVELYSYIIVQYTGIQVVLRKSSTTKSPDHVR